ncbi:MAG: hypothetical protein HQ580_19500 [Planctomycetes bacterium]|nr:hypothetical protein [Planctomycetota bacterium]
MLASKLVEVKMVVVEAIGTRKAFGPPLDITFGPLKGWKGDCAEMDEDDARSLLGGEALKATSGERIATEKKDMKKNPEKYTEKQFEPATGKVSEIKNVSKISEEERHGMTVDFALARPIQEKKEAVK